MSAMGVLLVIGAATIALLWIVDWLVDRWMR